VPDPDKLDPQAFQEEYRELDPRSRRGSSRGSTAPQGSTTPEEPEPSESSPYSYPLPGLGSEEDLPRDADFGKEGLEETRPRPTERRRVSPPVDRAVPEPVEGSAIFGDGGPAETDSAKGLFDRPRKPRLHVDSEGTSQKRSSGTSVGAGRGAGDPAGKPPPPDGIFAEAAPAEAEHTPSVHLPPEVSRQPVRQRTQLPKASHLSGSIATAVERSDEPGPPSRILDAPLEGLRPGHVELISRLLAIGLTTSEADSLIHTAANNRVAKTALDRLVGMATILHDASGGDTVTKVRQITGAGRGVPATIQPVRFGHNLPEEAKLQERLKEAALGLSLIPQGFDLIPAEGREPAGRPRVLGRVAAAALWYFQPLRRTDSTGTITDSFSGSGLEFLAKILGIQSPAPRRAPRPSRDLKPGEYVVAALEVTVPDVPGTHVVYVLVPVSSRGEVRLPSDVDDTRYRVVQGIMDGVVVEDPATRAHTNLFDDQGFTPLVLSRNYVPRRKGRAKKDGGEARSVGGVEVIRDPVGMYYLEPAWMAARYGFFAQRGSAILDIEGSMDTFAQDIRTLRAQQEQRFAQRVHQQEGPQAPVNPAGSRDGTKRANWY